MTLALQSNPDEMLAPPLHQPRTPTTLERAVGDLAIRLQVPAMVLQKLMLNALCYPVVHRDLTRHSQLEVLLEDALTGDILPLPPVMLSFLEEGLAAPGTQYGIPLTVDVDQHPSFTLRLSRAQWVIRQGAARLDVPLFSQVEASPDDGTLWLEDAFPLGALIQSGRDSDHHAPYFNFFQHLELQGRQSGVAVAIRDDADAPASHFGSHYSLHRVLVAQRHFIFESLRLGFAAVLVPQLCQKGLPMRYQVLHRQGQSPTGREHKGLEALQHQVIKQGTPDIWLSDDDLSARDYGGCQGLVCYWRQLELLVQREGCLPIRQRFLDVLQEDRANGRIQVRMMMPLLSRDEFLQEDELL